MERLAQEGAMVKRLVSPRKQQVTVVKNRGNVENKRAFFECQFIICRSLPSRDGEANEGKDRGHDGLPQQGEGAGGGQEKKGGDGGKNGEGKVEEGEDFGGQEAEGEYDEGGRGEDGEGGDEEGESGGGEEAQGEYEKGGGEGEFHGGLQALAGAAKRS